jgi:hypothetical protein
MASVAVSQQHMWADVIGLEGDVRLPTSSNGRFTDHTISLNPQ